ncbi:MAG: Uma2 family endonuclease [bacterium]
MSLMPATIDEKLITGNDLLKMKDTDLCELVEGRIMPMSPTGGVHGFIESKLTMYLCLFVQPKKLGWVLNGEVGIYTKRNPDTVRGADIAFFSRQRLPSGPPKGFFEIAPELIVEIFSPHDTWKEMHQKIAEYLAIGVSWVWVIDPAVHTLWVHKPGVEAQALTNKDILKGEGILTGFELNLANLFEE